MLLDNKNSNPIIEIIDFLGLFAPYLLFVFSCILLWYKPFYLVYYIIGYGFNILLNIILKITIQDIRPSEDPKLINIAKNNGKNISYDVYGMPSGHAQLSFYSTVFIYLVFKNIYLTLFYFVISLLTLHHRVQNKKHTVLQVFIGSFVGITVSYFIYEMTKKNISGKWNKKKDDYALN